MTLPFFASDRFHLHGQMQHILVSHHIPLRIDKLLIHRTAIHSPVRQEPCKIAHPVGVPEHKVDFHAAVTGHNRSVQASHKAADAVSSVLSLTRTNGENPLSGAAFDASFCRPDKSTRIIGGCHFSLEGAAFDGGP